MGGFSGRRWGGKGENRGGLKSSRDAQREETLKMTQFITITATKGGGENEGERRKREQEYVLQYISKTGVSV